MIGPSGPVNGQMCGVRPDVVHQAFVRGEVRRRRWRAVALEIDRRGHHGPAQISHPARHQRDIGDVAGPHRQIQPLLDHVGELIADDQLDPQARMARRQHGQTRREKPRTGHRDADAHQPRQRPALPPQRGLHLLGALQQVTGMAEQRLAIVGQAEASRRAVEQAHLEVLFQRRDLTGHRRLAGVRLPRDSRERAGLGHPDKSAQSADQVHDFPTLRKDEFQESRIIFPRQEVYLMAIAIRDSTADLPAKRSAQTKLPPRQREQTKENDDEDHDACRGGGAFARRRLRLRRRGDGGQVANTFFTELPGVVAQAPSQQVPSAVARNQTGGAPTAAFVTSHSSGTWLFPPYQGNG